MGEPFLMMEALKEYSYVMKIPNFENLKKWNETEINRITFEMIDQLRIHPEDISPDVL